MKYTLCKHRSQSETASRLSVRNVHIPHVQQLHQFKHLEAWMCQSRIQVVWGPAWWDYSVQESISHKAEDTNQPGIIRFPAFTLSIPSGNAYFKRWKTLKGKSSGPSVTPGWTASALRDPASHPGSTQVERNERDARCYARRHVTMRMTLQKGHRNWQAVSEQHKHSVTMFSDN